MKEDIEEELINFVKKNYDQKKIKSLNITWYGGEPLLNFGSISRLSNTFIHFSEKDNCSIYLHNIEKTIRKYVDYHFDLR